MISACDISSQKAYDNSMPVNQINDVKYNEMNRAYFASGCFWCVETIYESLDGVKDVYSGYAGGSTINPNYYQVISCLLYTSPSPRYRLLSRIPSSA